MQRSSLLLTGCAAAGLVTGTASADQINFDDIDTLTSQVVEWQGDRYLSQGVLFSTTGLTLGAYRHSAADSSPNMVAGSSLDPPNTPNRPVTARFVNPADQSELLATDFVSLWINDSDAGGGLWEVRIFNVSDQQIGSQTGSETNGFVSFDRPAADIHRVDVLFSPDLEGMDTFTFNSVLPEPASAGLLIGVTLPILARRRRS